MKLSNSGRFEWIPVPKKGPDRDIDVDWFYAKDKSGNEFVVKYNPRIDQFFVHGERGFRGDDNIVEITHYYPLRLDRLSYCIPRHLRLESFDVFLLSAICDMHPEMKLGYRAYCLRSLDHGENRYDRNSHESHGLNARSDDVIALIDRFLRDTNNGHGIDAYVKHLESSDPSHSDDYAKWSDFYGDMTNKVMAVLHFFNSMRVANRDHI